MYNEVHTSVHINHKYVPSSRLMSNTKRVDLDLPSSTGDLCKEDAEEAVTLSLATLGAATSAATSARGSGAFLRLEGWAPTVELANLDDDPLWVMELVSVSSRLMSNTSSSRGDVLRPNTCSLPKIGNFTPRLSCSFFDAARISALFVRRAIHGLSLW